MDFTNFLQPRGRNTELIISQISLYSYMVLVLNLDHRLVQMRVFKFRSSTIPIANWRSSKYSLIGSKSNSVLKILGSKRALEYETATNIFEPTKDR